MNFGVLLSEADDISMVTPLIEPAEHLVELLAQKKPNDRHGEFLKLHRPAHYATENLRRLKIGQFASCDFQLQPDEVVRALKSQCRKAPISSVAMV